MGLVFCVVCGCFDADLKIDLTQRMKMNIFFTAGLIGWIILFTLALKGFRAGWPWYSVLSAGILLMWFVSLVCLGLAPKNEEPKSKYVRIIYSLSAIVFHVPMYFGLTIIIITVILCLISCLCKAITIIAHIWTR